MRNVIKKFATLFLSVLLLVNISSTFLAVKAGATSELTDTQIEAALEWASEYMLGRTTFDDGDSVHYWCTRFVRDAFYEGGLPYRDLRNAKTWANMWTTSNNLSEIPPRGALTFYDYWATLDGVYDNYGHVAISLGDGRVVHAVSSVKIENYNLSNYSNLEYIGWGVWDGYTLPNTPDIDVPAYDKQLSSSDVEVTTALALILNQNNNTVRAGKTKKDMMQYHRLY